MAEDRGGERRYKSTSKVFQEALYMYTFVVIDARIHGFDYYYYFFLFLLLTMGSSNNRLNCVFTALLLSINATFSYCLSINDGTRQWTRRDIISRHSPAAASAAALLSATSPFPSNAAPSLASKLSERDPSLLKNSVFNIPPPVQTYPPFLTGDWDITMKYRGFIFPSSNIPKEKLIKNFDIPVSSDFVPFSVKPKCIHKLN